MTLVGVAAASSLRNRMDTWDANTVCSQSMEALAYITFSHGERHLQEANLNMSQVQQSIAREVVGIHPEVGAVYDGRIVVDGINIRYRAYGLTDNLINVEICYPIR